jgi:hypothetical protein
MENAVVALISIAIILGGTMTLMLSAIPIVDTLSTSWKQMTQQAEEIRRMDIAADSYSVSGDGVQVEITVRNDGKVSLCDFGSWDVIVKYYNNDHSYLKWLPYTSSNPPEDNKWTMNGIYFNGSAETIEPNILNPGEDMKILMQLNPVVSENTTNWVTISTPSGISAQLIFQRGGT